MAAGQRVELPGHLWAALDEMAKDAALGADALVESAVVEFVALQGYDVPPPDRAGRAPRPVEPAPLLLSRPTVKPESPDAMADDDEDGLARTVARAPSAKSMPALEPLPPDGPSLGMGPTLVPVRPNPPPPPPPAPAPAAIEPAKPATKSKIAPAPPAPLPEWATPAARSDADEERAAARERMAAVYADVEWLTLERPTTTPLGAAEAPADGDDAADEGEDE